MEESIWSMRRDQSLLQKILIWNGSGGQTRSSSELRRLNNTRLAFRLGLATRTISGLLANTEIEINSAYCAPFAVAAAVR